MNKYLLTCGDVNGIGLEIIIKTLNRKALSSDDSYIIISPSNAFNQAAEIVTPEFNYKISSQLTDNSKVSILDTGKTELNIGKNTKYAGEAAYMAIRKSFELLNEKRANAVITAPISKTAINLAGLKFPGHTEMYAHWCKVKNHVMMFLSEHFNAALTTIHIPISEVSYAITSDKLIEKGNLVHTTLKEDLGIPNPKIAVLGLNPHAGESGIIGREEEDIIIPAIKQINNAAGPFSPDAFFANKLFKNFNCVLGMYHDQVLIPFKMLNFAAGVNYTAGLPIIRTSPDHGTAFDIAGKGIADESSMVQALEYAQKIVTNRKHNG